METAKGICFLLPSSQNGRPILTSLLRLDFKVDPNWSGSNWNKMQISQFLDVIEKSDCRFGLSTPEALGNDCFSAA